MKKKQLACLTLALPALLLSGCMGTPSLVITANWYRQTSIRESITGTQESLTYAVTYDPESGAKDADLKVEYDPGTYTTFLEDTNLTVGETSTAVYHYRTELTIKGRYLYKGERGADFEDSVLSEVWFRNVAEELRPIRSVKTVVSTAPDTSAKSVSDASFTYRYSYAVEYDEAMTKATVVYTDLNAETPKAEEPKEIALTGKGSYFDNEQILFALRGLSMSAEFTFRTVNPLRNALASVASSGAPTLEPLAANFTMNTDGTEETVESLDIQKVTISYGGKNPGGSQTLYYAKTTSAENNRYRNALVRMETPLLSDMGTLVYSLRTAKFNSK